MIRICNLVTQAPNLLDRCCLWDCNRRFGTADARNWHMRGSARGAGIAAFSTITWKAVCHALHFDHQAHNDFVSCFRPHSLS